VIEIGSSSLFADVDLESSRNLKTACQGCRNEMRARSWYRRLCRGFGYGEPDLVATSTHVKSMDAETFFREGALVASPSSAV